MIANCEASIIYSKRWHWKKKTINLRNDEKPVGSMISGKTVSLYPLLLTTKRVYMYVSVCVYV